jgi:hypothetical protein
MDQAGRAVGQVPSSRKGPTEQPQSIFSLCKPVFCDEQRPLTIEADEVKG